MKKLTYGLVLAFLLVSSSFVIAVNPVTISPTNPTTSDNLVASRDPATGEVFKWFRDGSDSGLTGKTLSASQTAKDEIWYVSVWDGGMPSGVVSNTLTIGNSAPTFNFVERPIAFVSDEYSLQLSANDADGDSFIYSATGLPTGASLSTGGLFKWTPDDGDVKVNGFSDITFTVSDGTDSASKAITLKVYPDYCSSEEYYPTNKIEIGDIDFSDKKYKVGDKISVTVEDVEANVDLENVEVELFLFNVDSNEEILNEQSSDSNDIDDGDKEDYDIEITVPNDEEIGDKDDYVIFAVVTAEDADEGDDYCFIDFEDVRIERADNDVNIKTLTFSPSSVCAGDLITAKIAIENEGTDEEDDVYVRILASDLGVDVSSNKVDLEAYDDSDNDASLSVNFNVPKDAASKTYSIEAIVYYNDGDDTESKFENVVVKSCGAEAEETETVTEEGSVDLSVNANTNVNAGKSFTIPVTVTNNLKQSKEFTVVVTNLDEWADPVSDKTVALMPGKSSTVYFYLQSKEDVEGTFGATVYVKDGTKVVETKDLAFNVAKEAKTSSFNFSGFDMNNSTLLWILGDIVLVVIAIFFLVMLFRKRK